MSNEEQQRKQLRKLVNDFGAQESSASLPEAGKLQRELAAIMGSPEQTASQSPHEWMEPPARHVEANNAMTGYVHAISDEVNTFRQRTHREAERSARQAIMRIMGALTERFGATSSWLFLKLEGGRNAEQPWIEPTSGTGQGTPIGMRFCHNTGVDHLVVTPGEKDDGIAGHVAVTRRPYLSNDVSHDPHYRAEVESTKSEITVPIPFVDSDNCEPRLIGVLNLESNLVGAFLEAHKGELMAAASELAPHILVLHHLQRDPHGFGWHPDAHGWTLEKLLAGFCNAVSFTDDPARIGDPRVVLETNPLPRPSCAIWYFDHQAPDDESLYVRGTSRYDHEYITDRRLPKESFTGRVALADRGYVGHGIPTGDLKPPFKRDRKARKMDMAYAFASPIYRPAPTKATGQPNEKMAGGIGSVNVYYFGQELEKKQITRDVIADFAASFPGLCKLVASLAAEVGSLVTSWQSLRIDVASAYLRHRLHEQSLAGIDEFSIIKNVVLECLDTDWCSIFARDDRELRCVASTGLIRNDGSPVKSESASYDLDDPADQGLTAWLASDRNRPHEPQRSIRTASVTDPRSQERAADPLCAGPSPPPVNKFRETFSLTETEHRSFLGIAVDGPCEDDATPLGVIRAVRRYRSRPFVDADTELFHRLAQASRGTFLRRRHQRDESMLRSWRRGRRYSFLIPAFGSAVGLPQLDAIDRLAAAFPAGAVWNRQQVDAVLLDLVNVFRKPARRNGQHGAFMASLRLLGSSGDGTKEGLHIHAIHSLWSTDLPDEELTERHLRADTSLGLTAIKARQPITFDGPVCREKRTSVPILRESDRVRTGVCMPVRSISSNGVFWGVLSVDFDDRNLDFWSSERLEIVALGAKKLDFLGRDNHVLDKVEYSHETWPEACRQFLDETLPAAGVAHGGIFTKNNVRLVKLDERLRELNEELKRRTENCRDEIMPAEEGIRTSDEGGFQIPLWYGPFRTELTLRGFLNDKPGQSYSDREFMATKLAELSHLWNRFVSSSVGTGIQPFFKLSFVQDTPDEGFVRWKPQLSLAFNID
jgi:hypothetical protein